MAEEDGRRTRQPSRCQPVEPGAGQSGSDDSDRAAAEAALRKRLIALKAKYAAGERPLGKPHGRWLADFLDQESESGLLTAEEKLLAASIRGVFCVLGRERPPPDADPRYIIRGPFLRFLALGGDDDAPVHEEGVQLTGAVISDRFTVEAAERVLPLWLDRCRFNSGPALRNACLASLSLAETWVPDLNAEGAEITGDMFLCDGFEADGAVRLLGAKIGGTFDCSGGKFRNRADNGEGQALACDRAEIAGGVCLGGGFEADGEVRLLSTKIGRQLDCEGGKFRNRTDNGGGKALFCDRAEITGTVFLSDGFEAKGEVRFLGAKIGGQLGCSGGKFRNLTDNGQGKALACDQAEITGNVFLSGEFAAEGEVRLPGAKIGGNLVLNGGTFINSIQAASDSQIRDRRPRAAQALRITTARIEGVLWMGPAAPPNNQCPDIQGSVDLLGAYARELVDHPDAWPGEDGTPWISTEGRQRLLCTIALNGLTYDRLSGRGKYDAGTRIQWLARQPREHRQEDFRPQPYEQLTIVLRAMGHEDDAREIAIEKQKIRHRALTQQAPVWRKPLLWLKRALFGVLTGYGYRPARLFALLIALWCLCGYFYGEAAREGIMAPSNPLVALDDRFELCRPPRGNWTECPEEVTRELQEYEPFHPYLYSADVMLPVIDLHQESAWAPMLRPMKALHLVGGVVLPLPAWPWLGWSVVWFEIIFGWFGSLLLVAVISGLVKRD